MRRNRIRNTIYIVLIAVCVVVFPRVSLGQSYRRHMEIAPEEVYSSVFEYLENDEYEKIGTALAYVDPVFNLIKDKYGVEIKTDIKTAIGKKDKEEIKRDFIKLIYYDMCDLLNTVESRRESPEKLRVWLKMAYANYAYLSPTVISKKKAFRTNQIIKKEFNRADSILSPKSPYSDGEIRINLDRFKKSIGFILTYCMAIFKEYEIQKKVIEGEGKNVEN